MDAPILTIPDNSNTFELHIKASSYVIGVMLARKGRVITYGYHNLNLVDRNYAITGRKWLAVIWAL